MSQFIGYLEIGITQGFVYGLLALGIVLVYKGSRTLNFAHPYFGLLCAFNCWWLAQKATFFPFTLLRHIGPDGSIIRFAIAVVLSLALIALNGWSIEKNIIRHLRSAPRLVVLVATIAIAQGTVGIVALLFTRTINSAQEFRSLPRLGAFHFRVGTAVVTTAHLAVLATTLVVCTAAALFFSRTKFGVAIRAAAENGDAARLLGISVDRVSVFTWVAGSVLAGIAGLLITEVRGSLDVATLSTGFLVRGLAAALVGGLTSLPGAVVGGVIVGLSESMLNLWFRGRLGVPETALFGLVITFLILRPRGLFGQTEQTEDKVAFVPAIKALPARLRTTVSARWMGGLGWLVVVFALALPAVTGPVTNAVLIKTTTYAIVGVSLTVLMGYAGQISLGHWGLVGVGAFATAGLVARAHVPFLLAVPLSVLIGMTVALAIGLPALRIRGSYLAVATLSFNLAAEFFLFKTQIFGHGSAGVSFNRPKLGPLDLNAPSYRPLFYFGAALLGLAILAARNLARSRTGRGFFALRENEKAAATLGVRLTRYKLLAFAVSGGIAAAAGSLYATYLGLAQSRQYGTDISLTLVAMVMIGGLGSLPGAVLGAFAVAGLPDLLHFSSSTTQWVVSIGTGVALLLVIIRARGGIAGMVTGARDAMVEGLAEMERAEGVSAATAEPAGA